MKNQKILFWSINLVLFMCMLLACSHKEEMSSYLDSLEMAPPVAEPLSFEIIGHRGYGSATPENTLAALRRSVMEGVEVAEVDIRLTSDGIPVLLHDESLSRTTGNSHRVSELSLTEIQKLDAGSTNSKKFRGEKIPTLEEALVFARGKLKMLLHMKLPDSGPVIADVIRKTDFPVTDIWMMSDQFDTLTIMQNLLPGVSTVHLVFKLPAGPSAQQAFVQEQKKVGATRAALSLEVPDEDYMLVANKAGLRVIFWTADHPYDSVEVDRFTADGVITNKPLMWEDWAARIPKEKRSKG